MGLEKRTYKDKETVITAQNLNEIQDAIIALENGGVTDEHINSLIDTKLGVIADAAY